MRLHERENANRRKTKSQRDSQRPTADTNGTQPTTPPGRSRAAQTVAAAAAGVSAHIGWQLISRIVSFALRAIVLRYLGPTDVASNELNVSLVYTLLVLPITGFRKVSLRVPYDTRASSLCRLCVAVTISITILVTSFLAFLKPDQWIALFMLSVTLTIRASAEPDVVFTTRREHYAANSRSRAGSVFASGLAAAIAVRLFPAGPAAASGYLIYSISMLTLFFYARSQPIPQVRRWWQNLWREDIVVIAANTWQAFLKYLLGNGEAFVLALRCPKSEHGAYILAGNFASIVLRFFHDGLEDQCFNVFHRLSPSFRGNDDNSNTEARRLCISTMHLALKASLLVSALFAAVGPAFAYSAVRVLYGEEWSERSTAAILLARYFAYLLFTSLNGVTEAFFHAGAGAQDSQRYWFFSGGLAISYLLALFAAASWYGAMGVIAVNCVNMTLRAAYAVRYYGRTTGQSFVQLVRGAAPDMGVVGVLAICRVATLASERYWIGTREGVHIVKKTFDEKFDLLINVAGHAISGALACLCFVGALWIFERPFVLQLYRLMRGRPIVAEAGNDHHQHDD